MASFSAQTVRVKGLEGLVDTWKAEEPRGHGQRRKSLRQGQQMRIFNAESLSQELSAIAVKGHGMCALLFRYSYECRLDATP